MKATISTAVDTFTNDPRRAKLLLVEALGASGHLASRRPELLEIGALRVQTLIEQLPPHQRPSPARAELSSIAAAGAISELLLAWTEGRVQATRTELVEYLTSISDITTKPAVTSDRSKQKPTTRA